VSFDGKKYYTFKKSNIDPPWWIKKFDYLLRYTDNEVIKCMGYYDKGLKIITFFYNQNINKTYRRVIKRQELEHRKQTFLIPDEEIRRKEKMSLVKGWMDEYGQTFLNADNVKRGDVFCITSIDLIEREDWKRPRVQATLSPVKSALEGDEYLAGLGKQNLQRLTEEFETDDEKMWLNKNIEVATIMTYHVGGQKQKGIVWSVAQPTDVSE
jgi:hypothetical protein